MAFGSVAPDVAGRRNHGLRSSKIDAFSTLQLAGRATSVPSTTRVTLRARSILPCSKVDSEVVAGLLNAAATRRETTTRSRSLIGAMHPPEG
eukprot:5880610-Prymnesium_polylepis.1